MERGKRENIKKLFGDNFIGLLELKPFIEELNGSMELFEEPNIHYSLDELKECSKEFILILGLSDVGGEKISIYNLRNHFGICPEVSEPCFYNQDWYLNEDFINKVLEPRWYLIKKDVIESSRASQPEIILNNGIHFPSAILCTYTFFAYYLIRKEILWKYDFIWCSDKDHNGDRIYVGKYCDIDGINKNGFSIHRHLALRKCYGSSHVII